METVKGEPLSPRVVNVEPMNNYILKVIFDNSETKYFDVKKILNYPCFSPLKNVALFNTVHAEYGSIAWADDIDYCPDTLYEECFSK